MMTSALALGGFVLLAWSASIGGAVFRPGAWYFEALDKPRWTPPPWLFAPAWALLFTLMGVAAWLVWREAGWSGAGGVALVVFLCHLPVNALWSVLFFGLRRPDWAGVEVLVLWGAILAMVILFWGVRPLAGALLLPYLAWVAFASALNLEIWRRNRGRIPALAREFGGGGASG